MSDTEKLLNEFLSGTLTGIDARIGDLLIEAGVVTRPVVEQAVTTALAEGRRVGEVLIERSGVTERDVYRQLARQYGMHFSEQAYLLKIASPELARRVPRKFLERHRVLPILLADRKLIVATVEAGTDVPELGVALNADEIEYHLITPTDYRRLRMALDLGMMDEDLVAVAEPAELSKKDLLQATPLLDTPIFDAIMLEAIAERASDIHLERYGDRVRLRLRVDGDLHDASRFRLTPDQYLGLVNVIKIKSNMDIAEHRLPQGGRFSTAAGGHVYDLRVQTHPSLFGEHVVIRLLSKEMERIYIEQLGLPPHLARTYERLLNSPSGLILVVGPTGSGKSTTLYAGLHLLAKDETRKVITVEDPIECSIENVQQTQVRPELGFAFAQSMRSFLREDPDVILVGEIRDKETALEALRASQTGHIVLSTLHCNDTVDAVQRLLDLEMHPNSVASELLAVFSQRLAKRICTNCKEEVEPDDDIADEVFPIRMPEDFKTYRGRGCAHCGNRGTYGRIAVVEYLPASPALRKAITRRLPLDELRDVARKTGLVPMRDHAIDLVRNGIIGFEELPLMFTAEQLAPEK